MLMQVQQDYIEPVILCIYQAQVVKMVVSLGIGWII